MKKGLDRCFLHYGIDVGIMAHVLNDVHVFLAYAEWMKENILKLYNDARNEESIDEKKLRKILNNALKKIV